ncbi:DegV family protein [Brevibacterium luteolum]|uniref:DegV family protein n=1 Tax=Brevibacterium luteolum TaxID=199591 RepID=A0A849ATL1_9MICO|nr:DegV family protein with EDD domain [Brevibacterium luteolum]NNG79295.1 DegV family protein [Brevibacterium luteolum]
MTALAVICDSTANIDADTAEAYSERLGGLFAIVDLSVTVGDDSRADNEWTATEVCAGMASGLAVTTSLASPEQFSTAISEMAEAGAEAVLVLTMSAQLSGTHASAQQAAGEAPVPVHVVDTQLTSAGMAGAVALAVAGAQREVPVESLAGEVTDWCLAETRTFFMPDSLEYLRRGGRIGAASSLVGRALSITPVLGLRDGTVTPLARVRTRVRAVDRVINLVTESAYEFSELYPERGQEVVLLHAEATFDEASNTAHRLAAAVRDADLPDGTQFRQAVLSTVVTAHVGPGSTGLVVQTTP